MISALIALYVLAGVYGAATATAKLKSEDALRPLLALAFIPGAFGLARVDEKTVARAGLAFCLCLVLNGAYGFLQLKFGELPFDRWFLKNPHSSQIWVPDHIYDHTQDNPSGIRGLSGLFYNRLKLAHLGIIGAGALGLIAASRDRSWKERILFGALFAILASAIALTYARLALAAFFVAGLVLVFLSMKKRIALAFVAASAVGAGLVLSLSTYASERFLRAAQDFGHRSVIFRSAGRMFLDHPLLGIGHGVYKTEAARYYPPGSSSSWMIDAHNLVLHVAAETGLLGLAGFLGALGLAFWGLVVEVRKERASGAPRAVLHRAALFGLIAVLVLGITHFPLHHAPLALAFWTLLGVAGGAERSDGEG